MNLKRYVFSKSFLKIFLIITITNLMIVLLISYINYTIARQSIINTVETKQEDITTYIGLQMKNMNDIVVNFCKVQYFNEDVKQLMYEDNLNDFFTIRNINRLNKITKTNIFIDSVTIYNGRRDTYYKANNFEETFSDEIIKLLESNNLPYLTPVLSKLSNGKMNLTYAMYETNINKEIVAAQLVNVDLDWLVDLLKNLEPEYSNLYLINSDNNEVILGESLSSDLYNIINKNLSEKKINNAVNIETKKMGKYYVNISAVPETDWILVNEQKYNDIFLGLDIYKENLIAIIIIVLIISIIISWMLASRVYRPFLRLSKQLEGDITKPQEIRDDVKYLEKIFEIKNKKIIKLEAYQNNTQEILDRNILLYLITDYEQLIKQINDEQISFADKEFFGNGIWSLVSIKIDYFYGLKTLANNQIKNIKETIAKYIETNIAKGYRLKWIYLGNGEFIIFIKTHQEMSSEDIKEKFEDYKKCINHQIKKATVSIFIDCPVKELSELAQSYMNIKMMYEYQMFYGKRCTVTYKEIENRKNKNLSYPHTRPLMKALKEGSEEEIMEAYEKWKDNAVYSDFEYYIFHVVKLLISLNQVVRELNGGNNKLIFNIQALFKTIFTLDTVEEIEKNLKQLLIMIYQSREQEKRLNSSNYLINTVKEFIDINYADRDLCLKSIAQEFNISTTYFGSQFKAYEGIAVSKYIHKVRLEKFVEALSSTSCSTKQLMKSVGYENESNFYKIFKKEFGITPNEYRILLKSNE
ncbi:AraC family transcriptional regulator [Vallitalea guaymasensis]|uniref:AraC family transcriptional regulator n=1 Tax=Vallitalea guaymasensis TaxID=1185412 RepID=UPI00187D556A|nr:helix-turn-helix domain-containing protein [Vallitalea guaymasensis]